MKKILIVSCLFLFSWAASSKEDGSHVQPDNLFPKVRMETSMGNIIVELDRNRAPITVNNFLRYAEKGSFDGTLFHRVVPGFVVQGGGYDAEFKELPAYGTIFNEAGNGLKNKMYTIAMARADDPHTAKRQFYFNSNDNPSLDPNRRWGYAVFGLVLEGAEVIDKMSEVETHYKVELGWRDVPVEPIMLNKVVILPPPTIN